VAPRNGRQAILLVDHLALLGDADAPVHGAGWAGQDGLVRGTAPAAHGAAAAVEQLQAHTVPRSHLDQAALHPVELPRGGDDTAVLRAVVTSTWELYRVQ